MVRNFLTLFENFAFRAFNFSGRATRAEYWCVMPLVWLLVIGTLPGDVMEFWSFLLAREIPPLNPLYYKSILFFVLTFIPRLSLTVRRLHDSGKSGKWAKLPFISLFSGFVLVAGVVSALMTSNIGSSGGASSAASLASVGLAMVAFSSETVWPALFATAALVDAVGWDAIWTTFSAAQSAVPTVDAGQTVANIATGVQESPGETGLMLAVMISMVCTPFVSALLHIYFMLLPSEWNENSFGESSLEPVTGAPKLPASSNPMAGYAHLFERSAEEEAAHKLRQKAELKELYQKRVLGQS